MNNNQQDPKWANIGLGDGSTTIGFSGCTISVIGDILGLTPDVVNQKLQAVNGFLGALIIWAKIEEAFPGVKINRVWSYNNDDVLAHVPNVIVEVPATPIGGTGSHWVNYIGNHQLKDPWTGTIRPTSDFPNPTGYCVIDITNYQPVVVPQQPDALAVCLQQHDELVTKCDQQSTTIDSLNQIITDKNTQISGLNTKVDSLNGQITDTQTQLASKTAVAEKLPSCQTELNQAIEDRSKLNDQISGLNKVISGLSGTSYKKVSTSILVKELLNRFLVKMHVQ